MFIYAYEAKQGLCGWGEAEGWRRNATVQIRPEMEFLHFVQCQGSVPLLLVWGFCSETALSLHPHLLPLFCEVLGRARRGNLR